MARFINALVRDRKAATAIEYGLILGLIAIACVAAFGNFGTKLTSMWTNISTVVLSH